jgi:hypothetical protein
VNYCCLGNKEMERPGNCPALFILSYFLDEVKHRTTLATFVFAFFEFLATAAFTVVAHQHAFKKLFLSLLVLFLFFIFFLLAQFAQPIKCQCKYILFLCILNKFNLFRVDGNGTRYR